MPVAKAWSTDVGVEVASLGVQVHGGMGFIEETGAAQHYRDARIAPIYEGTNGMQAMDLVGRKLAMERRPGRARAGRGHAAPTADALEPTGSPTSTPAFAPASTRSSTAPSGCCERRGTPDALAGADALPGAGRRRRRRLAAGQGGAGAREGADDAYLQAQASGWRASTPTRCWPPRPRGSPRSPPAPSALPALTPELMGAA